MQVNWRVRAVDAAMRAASLRISDATSVTDVQALRARRAAAEEGPLAAVTGALGGLVFGRTEAGVEVTDHTWPSASGPQPYRCYRPVGLGADAPLVVFFHGGGWVLGTHDGNDWLCSRLAARVGAVVVTPGYRLAPEHPAPAAAEDAIAAVTWAADHAGELGASGPLIVGGESAGGNLAALAAIACRDRGGPRLAGQLLLYPALDLTLSFPSVRSRSDAPILDRADMEAFRRFYLDGSDLEADDPRISPWFAEDLAGLPPAVVQTAEVDPLRDEGQAYATRLRDAGVTVRATDYAGAPHGFLSLPGACPFPAEQALTELVDTLGDLTTPQRG